MAKTAYLKQTSEERCREAFEKYVSEWALVQRSGFGYSDEVVSAWWSGWRDCWKYLEGRLLKEIQS